ncbi:MAG TPA: dihydrolipoamide acetyltransferase family protein, partial [Saprospiraceae bacterium]|nr:dihydrolipoamide acetyltransferase family protein [Saprospiraceae bacterium]
PKMGESIMEATILRWLKKPGDMIALDETILEIATDKVDSEIPSPVAGRLEKILFQENAVVPVGQIIAVIATAAKAGEGKDNGTPPPAKEKTQPAQEVKTQKEPEKQIVSQAQRPEKVPYVPVQSSQPINVPSNSGGRFYSPLVRNIASSEGIGKAELDLITGSGQGGRVTKTDVLSYLQDRSQTKTASTEETITQQSSQQTSQPVVQETFPTQKQSVPSLDGGTEIIEMDRMRKLIAEHMVRSKHTSPHVTSFVEVDVTEMVLWRERVKDDFQKKYGEKITYTPIFIEALVKAIRDFPMINVSVDGDKIILKKFINIGLAAALPSGNLIVPVIRNADGYNLMGLTKAVNDLANRARTNKLRPEEVQDGTFTLTNVGTFGNVMGTPIINQPQVAIMAAGAIRKKPGVVETPFGDLIAVRHYMFLSLSYDHRVVDGFLGGSFLRKVADYLESFDPERQI